MHVRQLITSSNDALSTAVEIQIWEGHLLRNKTNLRKTLCTYSLDNGPLNDSADGNLLFRFTTHDWEKNIRDLLAVHNVYYSLLGNITINASEQLLKKKVFVAEDDPDILYALTAILEDAGYHVKHSATGWISSSSTSRCLTSTDWMSADTCAPKPPQKTRPSS